MSGPASYRVVYSRRRNVQLTVERDGELVVRAPEGTCEDVVAALVESKRHWIAEKKAHPQKYQARHHPPGKELASGEAMLYLGRNYRVDIIDSDSNAIEFNQKFVVPRTLANGDGREAFRDWYFSRAKERLVPRADRWARVLGVEPKSVTITDVRYRWGSCTPAGAVRLNWRLIKAPSPVADYVVVHELAHLLESSHSPRFWSIVRSQVPRLDAARAWLRDQGHLLEQDL